MLTVLLDHTDFVVINKPANVHFHSQDGNAGVVAQLSQQLNCALYPVHRLDTMTSGVLLIAKSSEAAAHLASQFAEQSTSKIYIALAMGKPKKKQGLIQGDMVKARRSQWKLTTGKQNPAVTQFFSQSVAPKLRCYLLKPHTGKTHQLRVMMKSLGCAIVGDSLYGKASHDRGYLHAWQLSFSYHNQPFRVVAPIEVTNDQSLFALDTIKQQMQLWLDEPPKWPSL
ncbi:TIGR01621 family pseudouridine synthase [Paraferrimonas haliotis]|uniref:RNA pseudouridine synthase n=1 Tax=Paraferrimonas haliotis TaxID=2013866 RepID=A0AA37TT56_9GAMM|nr:TIGR01621 family pseudouridine synthase [Paraferrimonas haliotis]GLS84990.1 RNA pseudouridine synthase [Paraferrimonas haliotis]